MTSSNEFHKRRGELSHIGEELRRLGGVVQEELEDLGLAVPDDSEGDKPAWQGISFDMSSCDEDSGITDVCDQALDELIGDIVAYGGSENMASNTVYEMLGDLTDKGLVSEMPELADSEGEKASWIANAIPKIKNELVQRGFLPEAGAIQARMDR